jgi:hypothetical protein
MLNLRTLDRSASPDPIALGWLQCRTQKPWVRTLDPRALGLATILDPSTWCLVALPNPGD